MWSPLRRAPAKVAAQSAAARTIQWRRARPAGDELAAPQGAREAEEEQGAVTLPEKIVGQER